ncbi:hypothetical protein IWQ60_003646 [Tieghemiomyces parasiticus]|uniref:Uncharacterized protein n=1 Tax=Tieghemiomyces parasiticus TaxID=78921 RepID=A0A9W8DZV1_9FUNG|nr:hypothetical protein IWQ60_003646 [Tieghemiomyces parasiticus]
MGPLRLASYLILTVGFFAPPQGAAGSYSPELHNPYYQTNSAANQNTQAVGNMQNGGPSYGLGGKSPNLNQYSFGPEYRQVSSYPGPPAQGGPPANIYADRGADQSKVYEGSQENLSVFSSVNAVKHNYPVPQPVEKEATYITQATGMSMEDAKAVIKDAESTTPTDQSQTAKSIWGVSKYLSQAKDGQMAGMTQSLMSLICKANQKFLELGKEGVAFGDIRIVPQMIVDPEELRTLTGDDGQITSRVFLSRKDLSSFGSEAANSIMSRLAVSPDTRTIVDLILTGNGAFIQSKPVDQATQPGIRQPLQRRSLPKILLEVGAIVFKNRAALLPALKGMATAGMVRLGLKSAPAVATKTFGSFAKDAGKILAMPLGAFASVEIATKLTKTYSDPKKRVSMTEAIQDSAMICKAGNNQAIRYVIQRGGQLAKPN